MSNLLRIGIAEGYALVFGVCAVVLVQILKGHIRTNGLIDGRTQRGTRFVSGARVQLLITTLAAAAYYVAQFRRNPTSLPDLPKQWMLFLGGSHVLYLGNKFHGKRSRRFHI